MSKKNALMVALLAVATLFAACDREEKLDPKMEVDTTSISFDATGATRTITIAANHAWSVEVVSGGDWLTVNKLSGEAGERIALEVTAAANTSTEVRRGELSFKSSTATAKVTVEQAAAATTPDPENPDPENPDPENPDPENPDPENPDPENPDPENPDPENPNPDDPEPEEPEMPEAAPTNSVVINGVTTELKSTGMAMLGDYPAIIASPLAGLNSYDEIYESGNFFFAAISTLLNGEEFDPMVESRTFTIISELEGAFIRELAAGATLYVQEGLCTLTYSEEKVTFEGRFILADMDNTTLAVNIETPNTIGGSSINENTMWRGDVEKPLRTTFYMAEDGLLGLYFTPAGIEYFDELDIVTFYMYLMIDEAMATGEKVKIADLTEDDIFMFGLVDNYDYSLGFGVDASDLSDLSGEFSVENLGGGNFVAIVDLNYEGTSYRVSFNGKAINYNVAPETFNNVVIDNEEHIDIVAAQLDNSSDVSTIWLTLANSEKVTISIPTSMCDGNARGFSQSTDIWVYYNDTVYSKPAGYSGTLSVKVDTENNTIDINFTNYDNLEIIYSGPVTIGAM